MRRQREDELVRELDAESFVESLTRRDGPRIEALQVRSEQACASVTRLLGQDAHLDYVYRGTEPLSVIPRAGIRGHVHSFGRTS